MPKSTIAKGLGPAGVELVDKIVADMTAQRIEPDARESALLRTAGELRDRMVTLEAAIATDGLHRETRAGTIQLHPAAAELRQHAVALARVLAGIELVDMSSAPTVKSARHQRAAQARWSREKARNG
jgi:hypothetical protein